MIAALAALELRARGSLTAGLAACHALVVGGVAWYVVDQVWSSIPVSASLTPVPGIAFASACVSGMLYLLVSALAIGVVSMSGPWVGPDPTGPRSPGIASRAAAAWAASVVSLTVIASAALPIYLCLWTLGGLAVKGTAGYAIACAAIVLGLPLLGVASALVAQHARGPRWR
ncbi:MAG TPA: hypothetical protein VGT40_01885 [Methylomirabilota bacterium]|jgi:hypothetical protein|nr:hypothetical protein [Methylomirabilota bacterium]